jgi:hypothetical protein
MIKDKIYARKKCHEVLNLQKTQDTDEAVKRTKMKPMIK